MSAPERLLAGRQLFVFDLDGTLADTSHAHAAAFAAAVAPRGIAVDYASIAGLATAAAVRQLLAGAGQHASTAEVTAIVMAKRAAARTNLAHVREVAGARIFVERASRRHRIAVCTSAARATAEATLASLDLANRFDPIVTADDVLQAKPSPEGYLSVLSRAGVSASDALVFEDSDAGLAAAKAAGLDAIRIGTGGVSWAELTVALTGVAA